MFIFKWNKYRVVTVFQCWIALHLALCCTDFHIFPKHVAHFIFNHPSWEEKMVLIQETQNQLSKILSGYMMDGGKSTMEAWWKEQYLVYTLLSNRRQTIIPLWVTAADMFEWWIMYSCQVVFPLWFITAFYEVSYYNIWTELCHVVVHVVLSLPLAHPWLPTYMS